MIVVAALLTVSAACSDDSDVTSGENGADAGSSNATAPALDGEPIPISSIFSAGALGTTEVGAGAEAAVAAINAAGGVADPAGGPNRPFDLFTCPADTTADPNAAVQCARDAIDRSVVASVAAVAPGTDEVVALADAGIPMVGTSPTGAEDFTNDHVFPLSGGILTGVQGIAAALQSAGAQTVQLLGPDHPSAALAGALISPVLENGEDDLLPPVLLPVDPSADLTSFIAQVAETDPDGVVVLVSRTAFVQVYGALRRAGYDGLVGSLNVIATEENIHEIGADADGIIIASDYLPPRDVTNPLIEQFNAEMDEYAPEATRNQYSLNAWLSVYVLKDVIETAAEEISAPALLAALDGFPVDLEGVAPPFVLGRSGTQLPAPRVPRATVLFQTVVEGEFTRLSDGEFVDLNTLLG